MTAGRDTQPLAQALRAALAELADAAGEDWVPAANIAAELGRVVAEWLGEQQDAIAQAIRDAWPARDVPHDDPDMRGVFWRDAVPLLHPHRDADRVARVVVGVLTTSIREVPEPHTIPDPPFEARPGKMSGALCFTGTRIPVETAQLLVRERGLSVAEVCDYYPDLSPEWVALALTTSIKEDT